MHEPTTFMTRLSLVLLLLQPAALAQNEGLPNRRNLGAMDILGQANSPLQSVDGMNANQDSATGIMNPVDTTLGEFMMGSPKRPKRSKRAKRDNKDGGVDDQKWNGNVSSGPGMYYSQGQMGTMISGGVMSGTGGGVVMVMAADMGGGMIGGGTARGPGAGAPMMYTYPIMLPPIMEKVKKRQPDEYTARRLAPGIQRPRRVARSLAY